MAYYENSGQVNDEAISIAGGRTFQVIQLADSEGNIINPASGDVVNPVPTIAGLGIPPHDDFELNNADTPTTITYRLGGTVVATVTLRYSSGGGLIGGSIAYPGG